MAPTTATPRPKRPSMLTVSAPAALPVLVALTLALDGLVADDNADDKLRDALDAAELSDDAAPDAADETEERADDAALEAVSDAEEAADEPAAKNVRQLTEYFDQRRLTCDGATLGLLESLRGSDIVGGAVRGEARRSGGLELGAGAYAADVGAIRCW